MTIRRDNSGRILLPGRVTRTLTDQLIPGTALPAWQTAAAGTASFQGFFGNSSQGACTVTSAASSGAAAAVKGVGNLAAITPQPFQGMSITLEGLACDADTGMDIEIGFQGNASKGGASFMHLNGATTGIIRVRNTDGTVTTDFPTNYAFFQPNGGGRARRNFTFLLLPHGYPGGSNAVNNKASVALLEDDQVMADIDISSIFDPTVTTSMIWQIVSRAAAAHSISWRQSKLTFNHN